MDLSPESQALMIEAARLAHPREACGLIWGDEAVEFSNVCKHPERFFIVDHVAAQAETNRRRELPSGIWHSHPNGDPSLSDSDIQYTPADYRVYLVADGRIVDHGYPG